jgi:dsDNA-specific endonuclease/ATPase MutS2
MSRSHASQERRSDARFFNEGDAVQTPFGKGVVREVRNNQRLLVEVQGRAIVVREADVTMLETEPGRSRPARGAKPSTRRPGPPGPAEGRPGPSGPGVEIDLHGLTVEEALARVESALNDALLADMEQLRLIHGRSGGKIRAALHRRLRELPGIRGFRLDPRNEGITIVKL